MDSAVATIMEVDGGGSYDKNNGERCFSGDQEDTMTKEQQTDALNEKRRLKWLETMGAKSRYRSTSSGLHGVPEGKVRAFTQNCPTTRHTIVRYPGYVKNTAKALQNLGGQAKILAKFRDETPLELKFRPNDPGCMATFGEHYSKRQMIVKVRTQVNTDTGERKVVGMKVDGWTESIYVFNRLMDFQRLPPEGYKPLYKVAREHIIDDLENMLSKPGGVPHILPTQFTKHQTSASNFSQFKHEKNKKVSRLRGLRAERYALSGRFVSVDYEGETPTTPPPRGSSVKEPIVALLLEQVRKLFEKRPVWTRVAIDHEIKPQLKIFLRETLHQVAYVMTKGPWARCWVKFGYDPKTDPRAKWWQVAEVRVHRKMPILEECKHNPAPSHVYMDGQIASQRQLRHQLCDIHNDQVKRMCETTTDECSYMDGWLSKGLMREILQLCKTLYLRRNEEVLMERSKKAISEMKSRNPVDAGISALTLEAPVPQYALPHPYAPNPHATNVPPSLDTLSPQIQQSLLAREKALSDSIGQKGKRKLSVSDNSGDDEGEDSADEDSNDDDTIQQDQADVNSDSSSESDSEDDLLARDVFGDLSDEDDDEEDAQ